MPGRQGVQPQRVSTAWNGRRNCRIDPLVKTDIGNTLPGYRPQRGSRKKDSELFSVCRVCQRQADLDASFMWDFAQVGTTVVVL